MTKANEPNCSAIKVCGGGKKAKRKGETWAKWHCHKCLISGWLRDDPSVKCRMNKFEWSAA